MAHGGAPIPLHGNAGRTFTALETISPSHRVTRAATRAATSVDPAEARAGQRLTPGARRASTRSPFAVPGLREALPRGRACLCTCPFLALSRPQRRPGTARRLRAVQPF